MDLNIPLEVEARGTATSSYTVETIDKRLAELRKRYDDAARDEAKYLEALKAKRERE